MPTDPLLNHARNLQHELNAATERVAELMTALVNMRRQLDGIMRLRKPPTDKDEG